MESRKRVGTEETGKDRDTNEGVRERAIVQYG